NKLIGSVLRGKWISSKGRCGGGSLGTWASHIIYDLTLKKEFWSAVFSKLRTDDRAEQDYAFNYFTHFIDKCYDDPPASLRIAVNSGLNRGDSKFKDLAESWKYKPSWEERDPEDPWRKSFEKALTNFQPSSELTDDDVPF
ncbi:MAG: hypothetical protein QOK48_1393, partial [Blastocatellia bacterium]|nr:hypothetical protein [Blastocatellia bacterium]